MDNNVLLLIGRILFGGYFAMMGLNHFMKTKDMTAYAKSKGLPSPKFAVWLTGLLLLAGGLSVLLGYQVYWGVVALVVFLVPVTFKMHQFWKEKDPNMKMAEMVNFMKNMALLGGALMLLSIPTPWMYSI